MKLVIVESPKKSETIGRYLGSDFKVLASEGHIRDLSTRGKGGLGIDIEKDFKADWVIPEKKRPVVAKLAKAAKEAEEVYLATDPDREGEAISWHLAQVLHLPVDTTKRLQFHEITKPAITAAMAEPKHIDMNLVSAQETRRLEDRIIGFQFLRGVHLNDSKSRLGGRLDRHNSIGAGELGNETFERLMNDPRFDNIPMVLETIDETLWPQEIRTLYGMIRS